MPPEAALCLHRVNKVSPFRALRDWVVAAAAPRIARKDALDGEPTSLEEAVFLDGLDAVIGTSGRVATAFPNERRQCHLIEPNQQNQTFSGQSGNAFHTF